MLFIYIYSIDVSPTISSDLMAKFKLCCVVGWGAVCRRGESSDVPRYAG